MKLVSMYEMTRAECVKIFKSKIFWITTLVSLTLPLMIGFVMFATKNPSLSKSFGLVSGSGGLQGTADWSNYFGMLAKSLSFGTFVLVFGFAVSWVYGREYADRTAKDLLVLPISRLLIVIAKFFAAAVWCLVIFFVNIIVILILGFAIGLAGYSLHRVSDTVFILLGSAVLGLMLHTVTAFFASYSKGYIAPLGFIVLAAIVSNFIGGLGYTQYYPWSIPSLFAVNGLDGHSIKLASIVVVIFTGLVGMVATLILWRKSDQT